MIIFSCTLYGELKANIYSPFCTPTESFNTGETEKEYIVEGTGIFNFLVVGSVSFILVLESSFELAARLCILIDVVLLKKPAFSL